MKNFLLLCLTISLFACKQSPKLPDLSQVKMELKTMRFEKAFFAMDTLQIDKGLTTLNDSFPGFTKDFLFNILGTTIDSAGKDSKYFKSSYQSMYDSSKLVFADFSLIEQEVLQGLKTVKYYFPTYPVPTKLVTFIGPINSYANIITTDALAVGMQMYMGKNYSLYHTDMGLQLYPEYISRRFEKEYIPVNCIKTIIDDLYPSKSLGKPLVEQMIEAGKRQWLLELLMPLTADTIRTGYTKAQLEGCFKSEADIWGFFVQNNFLYESNPDQTKDYMNDGPNTPALGDASPGMIGQFVGTRIVQKWIEKKGSVSPEVLMQTPARQIFEESHYKPK
jgi:hypothetical protein